MNQCHVLSGFAEIPKCSIFIIGRCFDAPEAFTRSTFAKLGKIQNNEGNYYQGNNDKGNDPHRFFKHIFYDFNCHD